MRHVKIPIFDEIFVFGIYLGSMGLYQYKESILNQTTPQKETKRKNRRHFIILFTTKSISSVRSRAYYRYVRARARIQCMAESGVTRR